MTRHSAPHQCLSLRASLIFLCLQDANRVNERNTCRSKSPRALPNLVNRSAVGFAGHFRRGRAVPRLLTQRSLALVGARQRRSFQKLPDRPQTPETCGLREQGVWEHQGQPIQVLRSTSNPSRSASAPKMSRV